MNEPDQMPEDDTFEIPPEIIALHARRDAQEKPVIERLGREMGYGRMMQLCERVWGEFAAREGIPGSQHTVGPCASELVPCPHPESAGPVGCGWCGGSGRVTTRVAEIARRGYVPNAEG